MANQNQSGSNIAPYSPVLETSRIFSSLCDQSERLGLPAHVFENKDKVSFSSSHNEIYFPIPFKETETLAALKGIEGSVAAALADVRFGSSEQPRSVQVSLEGATAFACQAYMAKIDGLSKLDPNVKSKLKGKCDSQGMCGHTVDILCRYRFVGCSVKWIPPHVGQLV
ncbi:CoA-transferase family III [Penicillium herquei]|nr:CoA-transferase family III [Penicillium herquei]